MAICVPNALRSRAYLVASSRARCARPVAPVATGGRVRSNALNSIEVKKEKKLILESFERTYKSSVINSKTYPIAILKPPFSFPSTFLAGTTTSSNVIPLVSEHRCPMLISFLPT